VVFRGYVRVGGSHVASSGSLPAFLAARSVRAFANGHPLPKPLTKKGHPFSKALVKKGLLFRKPPTLRASFSESPRPKGQAFPEAPRAGGLPFLKAPARGNDRYRIASKPKRNNEGSLFPKPFPRGLSNRKALLEKGSSFPKPSSERASFF
jgi:hypothetical protein